MKERGEIFQCTNCGIQPNSFILAKFSGEVEKGTLIKDEELDILYASIDFSLADRLIAMGIAMRESKIGQDTLLIVHPSKELYFG